MKKFIFSFLLLASLPFIISCGDDDEGMQLDPTITTLASNTPDLSTLVDAVVRAGLDDELDDRSMSYTVLAPTNAAFQTLLGDLGLQSLDQVPTATLTEILLNHVVSGEARSGDLTTGYLNVLATESTTNNALNLYVDTDGGVTFNGMSSVSTPDVEAANGVVHIVDKVITLPTVVTFALADDRFSTLVAALTRTSFQGAYVNALSGNGPFTVFAPTNDAFAALLTELGANSLDDIDDATLQAVLNYHVVGGANVLSTALTDDMTVTTLGGETFTIDLSNGAEIVDNNNRRSNIIITDVQSANGVIHAIDKVILP